MVIGISELLLLFAVVVIVAASVTMALKGMKTEVFFG